MVLSEVEGLVADQVVVLGGEAEVEGAPDSEKGMQMKSQTNRDIQKLLSERSAWEREKEMEKNESGCVIQVQIIT